MSKTYIVFNAARPTTAAVAKVTTGTAIKTLLQLAPATSAPITVVEWGISFDGFAAAAPGTVELIDTQAIAATVTAFTVNDVMPHNDPNAPANTAGASGIPLNLGTALSGFTATAEGSIVATRVIDAKLLPPTAVYEKQLPLGREGRIDPGNFLRVRVTFAAAINALCYVVFEA